MSTYFQTREESLANRKWYLIDAEGKTVGRLASRIAAVLRGKDNPNFCSHNDSGDFVVVVNADKVRFTGGKLQKKIYYRHTLYAGGIKQQSAQELLSTKPERVLAHAVKGMLPRTTLGRAQLSKLKVYCGPSHPHQAQNPQPLELQGK